MDKILENRIFTSINNDNFNALCIDVFRFQYQNTLVYKQYVDLVKPHIDSIKTMEDIPFLPIELFKNNKVIHKDFKEKTIFYSSGTTGLERSKHFVADLELYSKSFVKTFEYFYGNIKDYCFLALLPGYIEREGSSLIYMVKELMSISNHPENGFYLNNFDKLSETITRLSDKNQKYILIGVSHALMDFADVCKVDLQGGIIIETGGMKGRRKEMLKQELHNYLKEHFKVDIIHSEYGMTELLSQAYSLGNELFSLPPWMKILIRDTYDPFAFVPRGRSGGINIIDLANLYSCSFIETKDLGRIHKNNQFEIVGRFDNSDIRGCNLLL